MIDDADDIRTPPSFISRLFTSISVHYQRLLDIWTPYIAARWIFTTVVGVMFITRILVVQGYYIVTYALGIYYLNLFIAFLTPKMDPSLDLDSDDEDGPSLPSKNNEEFKPFMRRLPEFKFWYSGTKGIVIAFICTFIEAFNVPVFWPILVMYFCILFFLTMKRQIRHMIKFKYLPFSRGKAKYSGKEDSGKVVQSSLK